MDLVNIREVEPQSGRASVEMADIAVRLRTALADRGPMVMEALEAAAAVVSLLPPMALPVAAAAVEQAPQSPGADTVG